MTNTEHSIRQQLSKLITNKISLGEFNEWLFACTWHIDNSSNADLRRLVRGIKRLIATYYKSDMTQQELYLCLKALLEHSADLKVV